MEKSEGAKMKKTKIVCTLGPATDQLEILEKLLKSGMNIARFNFSHGNHEEQKKRMSLIREASKNTGIPVALMLDTKGPEMRIGSFKTGKVTLEKGKSFILTGRAVEGSEEIVSINHKNLPNEVQAGDQILLSDGLIGLRVESVDGLDILTIVENGGEISNNKRAAAPGVALGLPPVSEKDVEDILLGISEDIDYIAASFVQRAADAITIRRLLEENNGEHIGIIAKIENAEGVANMEEILRVVDGFMVARGDLGVEIPAEDVPLIQKEMIRICNEAGKPVITATQMLESMITNPRPTRAEASDVANAILDGTDAIMLSGETASGQYPVEAVTTMATIALRTESALNCDQGLVRHGVRQTTTTNAISHATVQISQELSAKAVITATESGFTAQMVSKYRPTSKIVAVTPHERTIRKLQLIWGVYAIKGESLHDTDSMTQNSIQRSLESGLIHEGDLVIVTAGVPVGTKGTTNMIQVHVAGTAIACGTGLGQKTACGTVRVIRSSDDLHKFQPGDIVVAAVLSDDMAKMASQAAGLILEEGGLTSVGAIVAISFGIPALVGVLDATKQFNDGDLVTVDPSRGNIYQGELKIH